MQLRTRMRAPGFTLIELMVVVAVASILVAIAVPTYQNQIRHSRRTDAKTALPDMAVRQEKYLTLSNTYTSTAANVGYSALPTPIGSGGYYNMYLCIGTATTSTASTTSCTAANASASGAAGTSFVVSAIPVAGTSQAGDSSCQYFALDNTGMQFSTNSAAGTAGTVTTSTCWQ